MLDILFRDARIVDGSGEPSFTADVAVRDGRIVHIGEQVGVTSARVIDAAGRVLCPGFIDVHAHSDLSLLTEPRNEPKVRQGVTTELLGADGLSYAPLSAERLQEVRRYLAGLYGDPEVDVPSTSVRAFLARLDGQIATNAFYVVPHQALRLAVRGWSGGPATVDELVQMGDLLREGLDDGALGLGTGTDYFPHGTCTTQELVALANVVTERNGVFVVHVRYNALGAMDAVREVIEVAERSGVRVLISHLRNAEVLPLIDEAREHGLDIQFDTYPYNAGSSVLLSYLPFWAHEGGPDDLLERLRDGTVRDRLRAERHPRLSRDLDTIVIANVGDAAALQQYLGRSLGSIMRERGQHDPVDTVCDFLLETDLAAGFIAHGGTEKSLQACMRHPAHMASTDAILVGRPHPRSYGTYPRYLGRYVRELGVLGLEQCVKKMTSVPAQCFGLADRGLIGQQLAADLVLFDPETVLDRATYEDPRQYPDGISHVVVNGELVIDAGVHTGALPGRVIYASAATG